MSNNAGRRTTPSNCICSPTAVIIGAVVVGLRVSSPPSYRVGRRHVLNETAVTTSAVDGSHAAAISTPVDLTDVHVAIY